MKCHLASNINVHIRQMASECSALALSNIEDKTEEDQINVINFFSRTGKIWTGTQFIITYF